MMQFDTANQNDRDKETICLLIKVNSMAKFIEVIVPEYGKSVKTLINVDRILKVVSHNNGNESQIFWEISQEGKQFCDDVHTIDEMRAWLKPLGYSDTINEAAIKFILREYVMSKVSCDGISNKAMIVQIRTGVLSDYLRIMDILLT